MRVNATPTQMLIQHRRPVSSNNLFALLFVALITKSLTVESKTIHTNMLSPIFLSLVVCNEIVF